LERVKVPAAHVKVPDMTYDLVRVQRHGVSVGANRSDMAMSYIQAGGKPVRETANPRPGIESCRCGGDITLDA
jgi:hypothetical protein